MQQQQNDRIPRLLLTMLVFGAYLFFVTNFLMKRPATPAAQGSALQQAQSLEAEGRKSDANVALADRVKKLEEAAKKYQSVYQANKKSPEGYKAGFQEINVYDYLATLEGPRAAETHWFDAA